MSDDCQNRTAGRPCTKRLSFQQHNPNLYEEDIDSEEDDDELTDEDFFVESESACETCSCLLMGDIEREDRELEDEDFYEVMEYDEDYSAYPPNMNSRYGYYRGNMPPQYGLPNCNICRSNRNMSGADPYGPGNYPPMPSDCPCPSGIKPCIKDSPCDENNPTGGNELGLGSAPNRMKSFMSCYDNTCGESNLGAKASRMGRKSEVKLITPEPAPAPAPAATGKAAAPPATPAPAPAKGKTPTKEDTKSLKEDTKSGKESPKKQEKLVDDSKEDNNTMLSAVISTVMLLAADVPDIPEKSKTLAVKYLEAVKDTQGQRPANIRKILRMLGVKDGESGQE